MSNRTAWRSYSHDRNFCYIYENGVYVNAVLPPACLPGECLLRTSLMATLTESLIDEAAGIMSEVLHRA